MNRWLPFEWIAAVRFLREGRMQTIFIISGIATGSIYGLAAAGLVLTYKTSGVLNFAHGAVAAAAAYFFYWLNVDQGIANKTASDAST